MLKSSLLQDKHLLTWLSVLERGKADPPMRTPVRSSNLAERIDFGHIIEQNNKEFTISMLSEYWF